MTLRIAFARINQETNCLSPVSTSFADFESTHFLEGQDLDKAVSRSGFEVPGMFRRVELAGFMAAMREAKAEVLPIALFSAWAVPSGPLTRECFDELERRLVDGLKAAGRLDGVYLCLHGAMGVKGLDDPEGRLVTAAAEAALAPVVVTHDLHANLTAQRVEQSIAVLSYKTNPHRDHFTRGRQAGRLLLQKLRREVNPVTAWRSLPMLLGGGTTLDFLPPMLGIFARLHALEVRGRVLGASVNMCHPWNDAKGLGWSTCVTTDGDRELAESEADRLAELCWRVKDSLPPHFPSLPDALIQARKARLARRFGVVTLCDASDVVTAGAPGENTEFPRLILEHASDLLTYVPLRDPVAVETLFKRSEGETVTLDVGGRLHPEMNRPLRLTGTLLHKRQNPGILRTAVLAVSGLRLVLTEGPAVTLKPNFFTQAGLDPWKADVIVVKNFFPFRLFFAPLSRKTLYVKTQGVTDFDAAHALNFDGPMHPMDHVEDWRAADERRRDPSR